MPRHAGWRRIRALDGDSVSGARTRDWVMQAEGSALGDRAGIACGAWCERHMCAFARAPHAVRTKDASVRRGGGQGGPSGPGGPGDVHTHVRSSAGCQGAGGRGARGKSGRRIPDSEHLRRALSRGNDTAPEHNNSGNLIQSARPQATTTAGKPRGSLGVGNPRGGRAVISGSSPTAPRNDAGTRSGLHTPA